MKNLLFHIVFLISFNTAIGQNAITGCYGRQDSQIKLNTDSTFFFFYAVDTYRGWLKGTWAFKKQKLILTPKVVYDTITVIKNNLPVDSLILSIDYTSERIVQPLKRIFHVFEYEQNQKLCPQLLKYKENILYIIENNRLQKEKIRSGYYIKPFNPWYTKDQCKY